MDDMWESMLETFIWIFRNGETKTLKLNCRNSKKNQLPLQHQFNDEVLLELFSEIKSQIT